MIIVLTYDYNAFHIFREQNLFLKRHKTVFKICMFLFYFVYETQLTAQHYDTHIYLKHYTIKNKSVLVQKH